MATQNILVTDDAWVELGTGLQVAVISANGPVRVAISATAPVNGDPGFPIPSGLPVELPSVAALGGGVWVRSDLDQGSVTYAVA